MLSGSRPTVAFVGGVVSAAAIMLAGVTWNYYTSRPEQINSAVCQLHYEIEKLKQQNRQDIATSKKNFKRNLKLLGIKDTPALDKAQAQVWAHKLKDNAPTACPFN